eukprot:s3638_g7.t1
MVQPWSQQLPPAASDCRGCLRLLGASLHRAFRLAAGRAGLECFSRARSGQHQHQ